MRVHTTLPASVDTPAAARAFAREVIERGSAPVRSDDVALVVSELVTNAVVHGEGDITVCVNVAEHGVDVEVTDHDPSHPVQVDAPLDAASGRGLLLVSRLAHQWGVREDRPGKVVWAHLAN